MVGHDCPGLSVMVSCIDIPLTAQIPMKETSPLLHRYQQDDTSFELSPCAMVEVEDGLGWEEREIRRGEVGHGLVFLGVVKVWPMNPVEDCSLYQGIGEQAGRRER
jgi:hypothetical protein